MISDRLSRRLVGHHLPLGFAVAAVATALYITRPNPDIISRLSFATAYPALILLAVTLLIGPIRLLAGSRVPASLDLRRDFGIWAGAVGVLHAVIGQCVHLRGRPWLYYVYQDWQTRVLPLRHDPFGFANYTGLAATLILIALLVTSNDVSLRRFGTPGWKGLQRWNYFCFGLTGLHTLLYQEGVESQKPPFVILAVLSIALTLTIQLVGFRWRKVRARIQTPAIEVFSP